MSGFSFSSSSASSISFSPSSFPFSFSSSSSSSSSPSTAVSFEPASASAFGSSPFALSYLGSSPAAPSFSFNSSSSLSLNPNPSSGFSTSTPSFSSSSSPAPSVAFGFGSIYGVSLSAPAPASSPFGAASFGASTGSPLFCTSASTPAYASSYAEFARASSSAPSLFRAGSSAVSSSPSVFGVSSSSTPLFGTPSSAATSSGLIGASSAATTGPALFGAFSSATTGSGLIGASSAATTGPGLFGASSSATTGPSSGAFFTHELEDMYQTTADEAEILLPLNIQKNLPARQPPPAGTAALTMDTPFTALEVEAEGIDIPGFEAELPASIVREGSVVDPHDNAEPGPAPSTAVAPSLIRERLATLPNLGQGMFQGVGLPPMYVPYLEAAHKYYGDTFKELEGKSMWARSFILSGLGSVLYALDCKLSDFTIDSEAHLRAMVADLRILCPNLGWLSAALDKATSRRNTLNWSARLAEVIPQLDTACQELTEVEHRASELRSFISTTKAEVFELKNKISSCNIHRRGGS